MLVSLAHVFENFLYDVFVARFDLLLAFGAMGQIVFAARFIWQWIASERAGRSVVPLGFWVLSIVGGSMTLLYGILRHDAVFIMGQAPGVFIYARNLYLIRREKRRAQAPAGP